jgi:ATP-dependent helicase/nuclease subunit B
MIYRIFGKSGYGKSEYLYSKIEEKIAQNPDNRFDMFLIVPEQQTLVTERKVVERFGNIANLRIEVISFDRMANRVSRKTGKMSYDYADSTLKKLVMNKTLRLLDPVLDFYAKVSGNMEFVEKIIKTIDEMKLGLISPLMLENAATEINADMGDSPSPVAPLLVEGGGEAGGSSSLINKETARKINEIGLIYSAYEKNFEGDNALRDVSNEMVYLCSLLDIEYIDYTEKNLEKRKFFTNTNIFIDSFDSFSNGQKAVISRIFDQAENVYITCKCVPYDLGSENKPEKSKRNEYYDEENIFYRNIETAQFIADLTKDKNLTLLDYILGESKRFKNNILEYLEKNLWRNNKNSEIPEPEFKDKLEIYECEKIFDEAETVAKKVLYLIREKGYKYSDIQIIASDISSYRGILDSVFEKYNIPLFISIRTQLSTKPLISMLLSLFDMINYDFRLQNIHSYIKNGLCGLTYKEIDDIDIYITAWQINGIKRYTGKDWNMHPDGYIEYDETDKNIRETLGRINETRKKFIVPVYNFMKNIKEFAKNDENNVKNITVAIIDFLDEIKTYERLYELQNEQKENGEITEAAETVQIWNILMELLQKIVLVCGDETVDLKRYSELFKFILNDIDIGKIPTSIDEVTALNANLMKDGDRKCTIIMGLNTDVFPEAITDEDLFGDREKNILKQYRIDFSIDSMQKSYDQLYYFYNAVTSASECIILTYRQADINGETMLPSMAIEKIKSIFPNLTTYKQSENFGDMFFTLEGKENGYIEMGITNDNILKSALKNYFVGRGAPDAPPNSSDPRNFAVYQFPTKNFGFKDADLTISEELANKLFHDLNMSSTKLDSYVNCPFSYFCKYILGLKSESSPKMQMNDIGKFIHKILEIFMTKIRDENIEFKEIKDIFIRAEAEKIIDTYLSTIIKDYEFKTDRFRYLLRRLNKIIYEIIKNLRDEFKTCDFIPADFELGINDKQSDKNNSVKPIEIGIPGKGSLRVTGIIDRVDIYKEGQNVYIRIVDYKTGSKKFNLSDVLTGLNLQMFIYLFSVWHNAPNRYSVGRDAPGAPSNNEIPENIPAGVLYMPSKTPQYEKKAKMSEDEISEEKNKNFTRTGLFLRDEKILNAMEKNLNGRYIPIKLKEGQSIEFKKSTASGVLASLEQIGKLERYVTASLSNIASELTSGKANIYPFKGRLDSCTFCEMKRICRFEENDSNKKNAPTFTPDKVWDIIDM